MKYNKISLYLIIVLHLTIASAFAADSLKVLPESMNGIAPEDMMKRYLWNEAKRHFTNWEGEYERLTNPEQMQRHQQWLRAQFIEKIGGLPERTPLNAQVVGVIERTGYTVEKIIFESQANHYVTALFFLPDSEKWARPCPGVIVPCGHSSNGKASKTYQSVAALLALQGIAALVYDPIDQGERGQLLNEDGHIRFPKVIGHTMVGINSILLGRNTARFRIRDGMRAIDYLQSRPEVNRDKIGCTGNSGGGTMTAYFMALDDRIKAAVPNCYITNFERLLQTIGPQDAEQNIFGQIAWGMDHADYLMMRAPVPILVSAATRDFFDISGSWTSFRHAKRYYDRLDFTERISINEHDGRHGFHKSMREAAVQWLVRWLAGRDEKVSEPEIELLTDAECQCTPRGQVMLLNSARSVYDLNRDYEQKLAVHRKNIWKNSSHGVLMKKVREIAGIRAAVCLPCPDEEFLEMIDKEDYEIKKLIIKPEIGIYLPALLFSPYNKSQEIVLYVHEKGKSADAGSGGAIEQLVKKGKIVLAVDVRGSGETQQEQQFGFEKVIGGQGAQDVFTAYLLGKSYVGMRAEDILSCTLWLKKNFVDRTISLIAIGNVGIPALHVAAIEPELFDSIHISKCLISWQNVIEFGWSYNQLINNVHGALTYYDLDNLIRSLGNKITVEQPVDAQGQLIKIIEE
ncbi:prolyl oligopeptidase family serine peptidase [candidate division KSB1 bacterium]|nr:prolyl oligopeptidase family serine peptidase [candidate division KSB1 bacterium]